MKLLFAAPLLGVVLAGCATRPADIAPSYVSNSAYRSMTCADLEDEARNVSSRAVLAAGVQERAATYDAAMTTVGVVLFWPAIFFNKGDGASAANLARLKGEMQAIREVNDRNGCGIVFDEG